MGAPAISVLMPVYNAERYVAQAMDSVLRQSFTDFELIVIDDGSVDRSSYILKRFAAADIRVRLVSRPNAGLVKTLNEGLDMARGELIARMDGDDLCSPDRFGLQITRLSDDGRLVAVGSNALTIDPAGRPLGEAPVPLAHEEIEAQHLRGISCIYHPAVMMRTEAVKKAGGYREEMYPVEDLDLWLRLGEIGRLENLPEKLFIWRRTVSGIVASTADLWRQSIARVMRDTWRRRGFEGEPEIPERKIVSRAGLYQQWGWMALRSGNVQVARLYGLKSIVAAPFALHSWRLWYCALRGR